MIVSLIAAVDVHGGIGKDNQLPWHLPSDLKRFKHLTMGHHVLMGRKTYETIGKPLPGRVMIVISHQPGYQAPGCRVVHSMEDAIQFASDQQETELFIIGGGEIFEQAMGMADKIYLTTVNVDVEADVRFPILIPELWEEEEKETRLKNRDDEYMSGFKVLTRKN